jgi:hypothetical protein
LDRVAGVTGAVESCDRDFLGIGAVNSTFWGCSTAA